MKSRTVSTHGPGPSESRSTTTNGGLQILNPSKDASAFTQSYELKRETKSSGEGASADDVIYGILPTTKVEIVPSDSTLNPKHVYVNISAQNVNSTVGIPAQYQIDFDQPFLKNSEKYYLTIAKASFPTTSIPLFNFYYSQEPTTTVPSFNVPVIEDYAIQMTSPASLFGYLTYIRPVNTVMALDGNYYVYYYQQMLDSVNLALMQTFNQLCVDDSKFTGTVAPFIVLDGTSNRFKFVAQQNVWTPEKTTSERGATLSLNYRLFRLFNSFPSTTVTVGNSAFNQILIEDQSGGNQTSGSQAVNPILVGNMTKLIGGLNSDWQPNFMYCAGAVVIGSDLNYYGSRQSNNYFQDPTTSPTYWQLICNTGLNSGTGATIYDPTASYVKYQLVYYPTANSVPYLSLVNTNLANTPSSSPTFWKPLIGGGNPTIWAAANTYVTGQNVYYPSVSGSIYTNLTGIAGTAGPSSDTTNWTPNSVFNSNVIIGTYSTLSQWTDIESIVIQTGSLPIRYEIFTPPQTEGAATSSSQVPRPVLTDLDLFKTADGFDRTPVQYVPPGPYRMIDMFARDELKRIDSYIQYKHKDLSFTDLIMLPGDYFFIKYLFIRNDALTVT
jgi:hypothetical protein